MENNFILFKRNYDIYTMKLFIIKINVKILSACSSTDRALGYGPGGSGFKSAGAPKNDLNEKINF